jgi:hypothetical protein
MLGTQSINIFGFFQPGIVASGNAYGESALPGGFGVGTFYCRRAGSFNLGHDDSWLRRRCNDFLSPPQTNDSARRGLNTNGEHHRTIGIGCGIAYKACRLQEATKRA